MRHLSTRHAIAVLFLLVAGAALAADHRDSPTALADPAADVNDIYAFVNPNDAGEFVVAATVHPRATERTLFSDAVTYRFYIENGTNDQFEFSCFFPTPVRMTCAGTNGAALDGPVGAIVDGQGLRAFAGLVEDPFFLDGNALTATIQTGQAQFTDPGTDTFAGFNTLAIVLGIPIASITNDVPDSNLTRFWVGTDRLAGTEGVNAAVSGPWVIVDDQGVPEAGQGFQLEFLASPDDPDQPPQFFVTFYGFLNGAQLWLAGQTSNFSGTSITLPVSVFGGPQFVPDFNPADLIAQQVGEVTVSFNDQNTGRARFTPAAGIDLPSFDEPILRLGIIPGLERSLPLTAGQVDRMGRPAVNTALIPTGLKDDYNANSDPSSWAAEYLDEITAGLVFTDSLDGIEGNLLAGPSPATLAGVLVDDRLLTRVDIADCVDGYLAVEASLLGAELTKCGGRTLEFDTVDATLTVVVSGGEVPISDFVDGNDVDSVIDVFPFFGDPQ